MDSTIKIIRRDNRLQTPIGIVSIDLDTTTWTGESWTSSGRTANRRPGFVNDQAAESWVRDQLPR